MQPTSLQDELLAVSRAVTEAQRHIQHLRMHAASSRVARRLEADVRRVMEDIDDLATETSSGSGSGNSDRGENDALAGSSCKVCSACNEPVFVPARQGEPEFQPECDDEGVAGGWQRHRNVSARRRRRAWV
ncbi:hypothetical protein [Frankia sp. Cppng1_Ct_nod]|uniref:hypothetical protein n=1 Tax=Frankia sp. Cppng1_Ct_nod TaxID=2897162 RepID=UPI002024645E|nr:hypothetical protein [Frankia sp. Cppng1_Ct_nod]